MAGAFALALALIIAPASARYELAWEAPAACPDRDHVRTQLDDALADSPASDAPPVRATGRIRRLRDGKYELQLAIGDAGRRTLVDPDCGQLTSAGVLIVAIAVDPTLLDRAASDPSAGAGATPPVRPPGTDPGTEPATGPPSEPDPTAEPGHGSAADTPGAGTIPEPSTGPNATSDARPPGSQREREPERDPDADPDADPGRDRGATTSAAPRRRDRVPLRVAIGVDAEAVFSVLPRVVAGLWLPLSIEQRWWRAELAPMLLTPAEARSPVNPDVGGRFIAWAIEPRGCVLLPTRPVHLPICAGVLLGAIHGQGRGDLQIERAIAFWAAADLGVAIGWRPAALKERLGLFVRGGAIPALTRPRFGTMPSGLVYETPAVGGRIGAGIEVRLR